MAVSAQAYGVASIYVGTGTSGALELLGWCEDRPQIRHEALYDDLKCDDHGGQAGPPADVQFLGRIDSVRCELSKWDDAVASKLKARVKGALTADEGKGGTPGTLLFAAGKAIRLVVFTPGKVWNYQLSIPREPIEINPGMRFSRLVCVFQCHVDATGTMYSTTAADVSTTAAP